MLFSSLKAKVIFPSKNVCSPGVSMDFASLDYEKHLFCQEYPWFITLMYYCNNGENYQLFIPKFGKGIFKGIAF